MSAPRSAPLRPGPPLSPLWWVTGPVLIALIVSAVLVGGSKVPYRALAPGSATPVEPLVSVKATRDGPKVKADKADRDLLYVTVSVREPTAFEALIGVVDDRVEVDPSAPFLGNQTPAEDRKLNLRLMADSQDAARSVALRRLGYDVKVKRDGVFVEDVDPSFPVAKGLKPGATIVGVDNKTVKTADALVAAIRTHKPGDTIDLSVKPLGQTKARPITATLGARPTDKKIATLGVSISDEASFEFPVDISIDTGQVGGPSAGLAFTLAILDRMSPGDLLGKERVAVTGTIELDGSIGPVGGVNHKTRAAIDQGVKLFIVPPDEYDLARKTAAGRLQVKKAATLDQALAILRRFGGDPLPDSPVP